MDTANPYESPQFAPFSEADLATIRPDRERIGTIPLLFYLAAIAIVVLTEAANNYAGLLVRSRTLVFWRYAMIAAVGIGALFLTTYRWWTRANTFPRHFGHWFLIFDGVAWISNQPLEFRFFENFAPSATDPSRWQINPNPSDLILALRTLFHVISCLTLGLAIWKCKLDLHWQRYAGCRLAYAAWCMLQGLFFASSFHLTHVAIVATLAAAQIVSFAIALAADLRKRGSRDYLHWLGVGVDFYMYLTGNIAYAWMMLRLYIFSYFT